MSKRYYRFAGITIAVSMPEELFFEKEYRLAPFRTEETEADLVFSFEQAEALMPPAGKLVYSNPSLAVYAENGCCVRYMDAYQNDWRKASARTEARGNVVSVQLRKECFPGKATEKYVLECLTAEHLIARNQGFVFHCAYIVHNGKAILFTAPSETGKSTQADLWNRYRGAEIINGDRAAVRLADGMLMAEGIPFAGSSMYCRNKSMPLEAIVYLSQAPVTAIRRLRGYEAFAGIWEGVTVNNWDREDMEQVSRVVEKTACEIPVYHLACTPDASAVIALEDKLREQVKL